jgi:hypothetical protein
VEELFDDGRGDVVRQIAGNDGGAPLGEIGFQDVGVMDGEFGFAGKFLTEVSHQRLIYFDDVEFVDQRQEMFGECAAAGTDFDEAVGMVATSGGGKLLEYGFVKKKMLA